MTFKKYLGYYSCNDNTNPTHLSMVGGKFNVPASKFNSFYIEYYKALIQGNESMYLVEKIDTSRNFSLFLDLEYPKNSEKVLTDDIVKEIIVKVQKKIGKVDFRVSKRLDRYHIHFDRVVSSNEAISIIEDITDTECIDKTVYKTGLRMLGSGKEKDKTGTNEVYRLYSLETGEFNDKPTFEEFLKTSILYPVHTHTHTHTVPIDGDIDANISNIETNESEQHARDIYSKLQECNEVLLAEHTFVNYKDLKQGTVINTTLKHCPFVDREHVRPSNPVYIISGNSGSFIKCHDSDCKGKNVKLSNAPKRKITQKEKDVFGVETYKFLEDSLSGTHYDIAMLIFHLYKNDYRVDGVKTGNWYNFDGIRWKETDKINIVISEEICKMYLKFMQTLDDPKPAKDIISNLKNVSFKSMIIKQLVYLFNEHDPKFYERLDTNENLIGFENGVYDFKKCEFRDGKPQDYLTFSTGYDYQEYKKGKQVEEILAMLKQILPNPEILDYTLTVISKALCAVIDEKFYMWTGISGANGKSTLINFLEYTLGDYITSINVGLLTTKRGNPSNASPDIFRLKGKRIFSFQEPEHDDKIKTGIMKQFTGGDTIIARDLFKSCISFKLQGTMVMCCNDLPVIESADGGTWRRLRVTEFNSRFCDNPKKVNEFKIDPDLKSKLKEWKQVFMSILIEQYKKFLVDGISEPKDVLNATNRYKNDNDDFSDFLDKHYVEDRDEFSSIHDIYSKFSMWWMENFSNAKVLGIKNLKKALKLRYGREQTLADKTKGFRIRYID